jgi:hypothetical protein
MGIHSVNPGFTDARNGSFVAELTIRALAEAGHSGLKYYNTALRSACKSHPPPYGEAWYGESYRNLAVDPMWLVQSLIANAQKEGEGSRKLWALAGRTDNSHIREQIRLHAIDESRHALIYLTLLDQAFPDAVDDETRASLKTLSPQYASTDQPPTERASDFDIILDEIIQMNIGEIRTRIHQLLMRPVINLHCPPDNRARLIRMLDAILMDETRHIAYTAQIIDDHVPTYGPKSITDLFASRMAEFNGITLREVGEHTFEGA